MIEDLNPRPELPPSTAVSIINMLRSAQQHHVMLSSMADQKASFLIGASVVTSSLVLGQWAEGRMMLPLLLLGLGSLLSGVCAALALIPRTRPGKGGGQSFNPLFFGHFTGMSEQDYLQTVMRLIEQDRAVYEAMARDIYQMGQVLHRKKFRYLGWGYRLFLVTLLATLGATLWVMHGL